MTNVRINNKRKEMRLSIVDVLTEAIEASIGAW